MPAVMPNTNTTLPKYTSATSFSDTTQGKRQSIDSDSAVNSMLMTNMSGVEGMPYQFMETVDRRITGTEVGRKFAEKIISRMPLLFLTPCEPLFMDDFNKNDTQNMVDMLISGNGNKDLINGSGRYYSVDFAYAEYYKYLNTMLSAVAAYLGIYEEEILLNGKRQKIGTIDWSKDTNDSFKTFFAAEENLVFYLDNMTQVSESFSNETTESSLASQINGFSDTANEIQFLFGDKGGALGSIIDSAKEATSSITSSLSSVIGNLGGGIVASLADKGVNTVVNGGKIIFPKIWANSSFDRSYSLDFKLRSPDHDSISIFLNVLKPYCKILALVLPRIMEDADGSINPNGFRSPFMVKSYCKGLFNIDTGIISSLSVTKGDRCAWNNDGLPTQIDISITIEDLYSNLAMSGFQNAIGTIDPLKNVVNNTAYMDFLANMAGLNIGQMEIGRRIELYYYLTRTNISQIPSRIHTKFNQSISKLMGDMYDFF